MGLFGKLFEKKECSICGGEIGLLGNRKLEDGNMCKECAKKLSPWFSDRRNSTVDEINEQLEYREANKEKVASFRTTRTLGENTKVLLDEDAGVFMVTSARDLQEANPDVLSFSDVTGCNLDIDEDRVEIKRDGPNGERVSYNPPRFTYYYDFYIMIHVRNPYFDEIRFKLNNSRVTIDDQNYARMGGGPGMNRFNDNGPAPILGQILGGLTSGSRFNPDNDVEFRRYREMGEEIREALLNVRQEARDQFAAAAAPKAAVSCPYCGATTTPDEAGRCEFCGGAING
ncbi:MAG: DUF4428 domain-containing protein [Bacillota bacterium]|nr:DUF4428 domain-containing protein [Bacillota bacterium]